MGAKEGNRHGRAAKARDSTAKDGSIKRIVAHLSSLDTRIVAHGKPPDRGTRVRYLERTVVPKVTRAAVRSTEVAR